MGNLILVGCDVLGIFCSGATGLFVPGCRDINPGGKPRVLGLAAVMTVALLICAKEIGVLLGTLAALMMDMLGAASLVVMMPLVLFFTLLNGNMVRGWVGPAFEGMLS